MIKNSQVCRQVDARWRLPTRERRSGRNALVEDGNTWEDASTRGGGRRRRICARKM
jgi:hypothetical protein